MMFAFNESALPEAESNDSNSNPYVPAVVAPDVAHIAFCDCALPFDVPNPSSVFACAADHELPPTAVANHCHVYGAVP